MGIVESAPGPVGDMFAELIRRKSQVAFSMRGIGPTVIKKNGYVEVRKPISIYTYDWVIHPSHPAAYMQNIISESLLPSGITGYDYEAFSESCELLPFYQQQIASYVKCESSNLKVMCDQLGINLECATVTPDGKGGVNVVEGRQLMKVFLEDHLNKEVDSFLLGKF